MNWPLFRKLPKYLGRLRGKQNISKILSRHSDKIAQLPKLAFAQLDDGEMDHLRIVCSVAIQSGKGLRALLGIRKRCRQLFKDELAGDEGHNGPTFNGRSRADRLLL